jgi:hypothetical protein
MASFNLNNIFPKPTIYRGSSVADQRLTVSSSAVQLSAFGDTTNMVMFDIQDADVMCTIDGSTPTASNGHRLYQGRAYTWSTAMAQAAKFIRQAGTDAVIHASECQL